MADRLDDVTEEVSSSQGKQTHEVGESSRPPLADDDIFRFQLVAAVTMFSQSPKPMLNAQEQVAETPIFQAVPIQPATFKQPNVGSNGQGSNLQAMQQVFPPASVHPGYSGGGSVFQSMAGHAPGNQFYTPGSVFGGAQTMMPNPMYGSIGMQPGFQSTQGQFRMPQENFGKKNSAKKYFLKEAPPKATQEPAKAWKSKATDELTKGPAKKWKRPFEQKKVLRSKNKCFIYEQHGNMAPNCPRRKRPTDSEDKEDTKGKKPMAGLLPNIVGDKPNFDASELCKAWGKVRDQTLLNFFDPGAKANFISLELASKLGIRPEEMEYTAEAALACHHAIGCDVVLGIPWMFCVRTVCPANESFKEDSARILRALRIAGRLEFKFARETAKAIQTHSSSLNDLPLDRLRLEAKYLMGYGAAERSLRLLWRFGILEIMFPHQVVFLIFNNVNSTNVLLSVAALCFFVLLLC
ncbi:hypothetical protein L7F22_025407 [Adiantum nelumboides]|nr:hypothetical protein [Adiantum nelumboides]